ncbi:hypothetical protein FRX31_026639 [Thalictrum thalictroides]|uniref:Uncharacterized protein n=1 Tax=Thalictrum thalictroides TaxID=46969 RepID=A0A7J6VFV3_THATH|nr:hypothetical protein FRX31_026639 [Thalictrum thalictroides]
MKVYEPDFDTTADTDEAKTKAFEKMDIEDKKAEEKAAAAEGEEVQTEGEQAQIEGVENEQVPNSVEQLDNEHQVTAKAGVPEPVLVGETVAAVTQVAENT